MKLFKTMEKKIASPENVDLLGKNFTCGSEYSNYLSNIRIREKEWLGPESCWFEREKCWIRKCRTLEEN